MQSVENLAASLRAQLASRQVPAYVVAARVRIHPVRFGRLLNGRAPLTREVAAKIMEAIDAEAPAK